ncbi:MAG TPA: HAMP domain-containing sensor histidine kinase [Coleofasciculaceae cyanobacterium]
MSDEIMIWITLATLAAGLGLGAVGGWRLGRRSHQPIALPSATPASLSVEQNTLVDQLRQTQIAYHKATEIEKFKSGFLARSSHELRSPINSVISLHQLILSDLCEDPAEEREFIGQAQAAAEKMLALLDRLISLSKMSYGLEPLQTEPLRLEDVFAEVQYFVQLLAQNRNIRLEVTPPDPDLYVQADPRWLRQILISLIDAPLLLMQEGYIRLKSQVDLERQQVQIWVEDERPVEFWRESSDLLEAVNGKSLNPNVVTDPQLANAQLVKAELQEAIAKIPSPGLTLLIIQTLLDEMAGHLEILEIPSESSPENHLTRIQCSVPLADGQESE